MNNHVITILDKIFDPLAKRIKEYIKNNITDKTIDYNEIKNLLLEKYLILSIYKNEDIAQDYLSEIAEGFAIYDRNKETKNMQSIKKKLDENIQLFINEIEEKKTKNKITTNKRSLESLFTNNEYCIYDLNFSGKRCFIYINNEKNKYEIISNNKKKRSFNNRKLLLDYLFNNINHIDEKVEVQFTAYKKKEFTKLANNIEKWGINERFLSKQIINSIKIKEVVKVNEDFSIKLVELYNYKKVFLVKNNKDNSEVIVHIYTDNIENAISLLTENYSKIKNKPESLIYQKNNKWMVEKINGERVVFSSGKDLVLPLKNMLEQLDIAMSSYTGQLLDIVMEGLNLRYLIEVRNSGIEGAENYLKWLRNFADLYKTKPSDQNVGGFKEKIQKAIYEYKLMQLTEETKNIIYFQAYQQERINGIIHHYNSFDGQIPYTKVLKGLGLEPVNKENKFLNEELLFKKIDGLLTGKDSRYIFVGYDRHQIAITYKKYSEGKYKISFFDPQFGTFEFDNIEDLKNIIREKQKTYGLTKIENESLFYFDEFIEVKSENYKPLFSNDKSSENRKTFINKGIAENLKTVDFSLELAKNVTARVIHYDERGILIVQIKYNDKLIDISIVESDVEDALYLLKDNINKIIEFEDASKIILKKTNKNVAITPIEFNTVWGGDNPAGYIKFNHNEYISIISKDLNRYKGEIKNNITKITKIIKKLNSNIYFEKLRSSFDLINNISYFINKYEELPISNKLLEIKKNIEDLLFYGKLEGEKNKILTLAKKNSTIATKLYQVMVKGINDGNFQQSKFIYDKIINHKFLSDDIKRPQGIVSYDYTIVLDNNKNNILEIIKKIDNNQLKNMIYYDGNNQIHLRLTYDELMTFNNNQGVKELLSIIDKKIDEYKKNSNKTRQEIFTEVFINNEYVNRVLQLEINELNNFFLTTENQLIQQDSSQYSHLDPIVSEGDIKELAIKNIKKTGIGFILFENNENSVDYIINNPSKLVSNFKKIITDLIPRIYQEDLNNYLNGVKNNTRIINLLENNEKLAKLIKICRKYNISLIAAGENDTNGLHNEFIKKNISIKKFYDLAIDNTIENETVLIVADKDKLYNFKEGIIYVEGISSRLNTPIFNVENNQIRRSQNDTIYIPSSINNENTIWREYDGLVGEYVAYEPIIGEIKDSAKIKKYLDNIFYANKIYENLSTLYPLLRHEKSFLLGYQDDIKAVIPEYSHEMTIKEILDFIILNKYTLSKRQLGAIVKEVDLRVERSGAKNKQYKNFTLLFDKVNNNDGIDNKAKLLLFPQKQLLLNSENSAEGGDEALTMLMLVAKYLEHMGDVGRSRNFISNLMAALSIINNKNYDEYNLRQLSQELVSCLNELSKNHHEISNTVGSVNNDKRSLDYVINKLTNKKLNSGSCYLQLYTSDHVITVWANLDKNNDNFGLYDPNFGMVEFSSKRKFISYLNRFFKSNEVNAGLLYGLEKNSKNNFIFKKISDINVTKLAEIKINNKTLDSIVGSNIINYQGIAINQQENAKISHNIKYKELFIKNKIREGDLLAINAAGVKGYYSFSDKKRSTMRKVVLLLSDIDNLETHYLNFAQEYHNAGYDFFIIDASTDIDAGEKAYDYLIKNYNVDLDSILLHGHNKSGDKVFDLCHLLNKRGYFPEGIVLSSSNNDLISVVNKVKQLKYKTDIYIAHDHQITDENNLLIDRILKSFGHEVKKFSFSHREEYNNFYNCKYHQPDPVRKFSIYQSRNLTLAPIEQEPIPTIGMPKNDQKAFRQAADSENVIIGVRPIDARSTTLIQSREYSSKGLLIKGKSSDWGPMAGFIPVDQSLAKLSARNNVAKYNLANQEALDKGHAISVPLTLSPERVRELQQYNILNYSDLLTDIIQVTCRVDNKEYYFYLSKVNQDGKVTYTVNSYDNGKLIPVNVLADPISKKPMIADYDLFTVMYSYNDLSERSTVRKAIPWEEWRSSVNYDELSPTYQEYYNNKDLYDRYEGEQLGIISQHVKNIKNKLNRLLQREKGKEMIHHGADDANPFSVITDNFPATFFVPNELLDKKLNADNNTLRDFFVVTENNVIIIRDAKEFSDFQQLVINNGFISPLNEKWNEGIEGNYFSRRRKSSENYLNNRELLEKIFSDKNKYKSPLNKINNEYSDYELRLIRSNKLENIINTSSQQADKEIELLKSPYNHIEAAKKDIDSSGVYNKLPLKLKKRINQYKRDLYWFKRGGYKIFNFIMSTPENYLNRSDSIRLNNIFNIILDLPEIKEPIYKSIYVDDLSTYTKNIDTGAVIAINSVLRGSVNAQKIKKNDNNVFISILGEHNARTMMGISNGFTDQVMIAPGKHFRVVSQRKENNKYYVVLEATDILIPSEPIFDLYDASLKGVAIDTHRSTVTEALEAVMSDKRLLDTINKINTEYIDTTIENNFIDKIINKKLTPEYAGYRYSQELSAIFGTEKNYVDILKKIINDPLSNKKYNQYINKKISREEWLASFNSDYYLNDLLKEKFINVKLLVDAIHDQPSCIDTLSDASQSLLMEFFAADFDTLRGKLLKLVSNQESYTHFIRDIEKTQFYLTQKNNFKDNSIHDVFYTVKQIEANRQNISHAILLLKKKLLQSSQNKNQYDTFILRLPFDNNSETSSLLTLLYASLNGKVNYDTLMTHINLLEKLYIKLAYNELTPQQLEYLSIFNALLTDVSQKEVMNNNMFKIADGILNNKISQLSIGNYLLEINTKKINLNISTTEDGRFIYRVFLSDVGVINITGSDREQMTVELFSFLSEINNVKNNIAVDYSNETSVSGAIYHVNEEGIISSELFDKFTILKNKISSDIIQQNIIKIAGIEIDKAILFDLGCRVDGKSIISINLQDIPNWQNKLKFDAEKLNDFFLSASGSEIDHKIVSLLKKILKNKEKNIKNILSPDTSRTDYIVAKERLMKIIELNNSNIDSNYWHELRNPSLKIPRHMRIISKIGYANIGFGVWQTIVSTLNMIESLENGNLKPHERKEIVRNLAIMWSEMAYNGLSEIIEIAVAKGMLKHRSNKLEYAGKISTRIGIALNILSVGFDIYNAYDNFSRISSETDTRKKIDYIVNGTFAVVSALVTIGVSIAILAGCASAGPVGIVIGAAITAFLAIYNAVRVIEDVKKRINFTVSEEIENGLSVLFTGDLTSSKKNEITLLDTKNYFRTRVDENSKAFYKKLIESNPQSYYFYTNEEYEFVEKRYYSLSNIPKEIESGYVIINNKPIVLTIGELYTETEAAQMKAFSNSFGFYSTSLRYYEPKKNIGTDEVLIYDIDFYVNELYKYNVELESNEYLNLTRNTRENINYNRRSTDLGSHNVNGVCAVYDYLGKDDEFFYFNTNNGNDIISAPAHAHNVFDVYNGIKRLSGGNNNDIFNLYVTESPNHASRFYGRDGIDTLRIADNSPLYSGYNINLKDNYVKFVRSKNQSNSIGFEPSTFYFFDKETGITSPFIINDIMPNISPRTDEVIAYLDSFENIICSGNSDDILMGSDKDNYIDAASGKDYVLGLNGNDTIKLSEGFANGGEGHDTYIISRLNTFYKGKAEVSIIIDEVTGDEKLENNQDASEQNIVKLEHNLKDIKSIKRIGSDIIFLLDNGFIINEDKTQTPLPATSIRLKNIFKNENSFDVLTNYCIITNDGFILNNNSDANCNSDPLFNFSYMENYSNLDDKYEYIYINSNNREFNLRSRSGSVKYNILPELKYSGLANGNSIELSIEGDSGNNTYLAIDHNARITLTAGVDVYQLKTFIAQNSNERIKIFPSKTVDDESVDNLSTFILPDVSGYDLKFENGVISHRYNPAAHRFIDINMTEKSLNKILNSGIQIRFIDKDNKMFILPNSDSGEQLLIPVVKEKLFISYFDDHVIIPKSLILNKIMMENSNIYLSPPLQQHAFLSNLLKHNSIQNIELLPVIDLLTGDDMLINKNQGCSVIAGGKGNDTLIVEGGQHILFANEGDDKLYGGKGNDVLISESGNDYLEGGEGDDIYLINKHHGEITINDHVGKNVIFITGLDKDEVMLSSRDNDDEVLLSQDKSFTVRIKNKYKEELQSTYQIEQREEVLSDEALVSIVHEMAQFNQTQLSSMQGTFLPEAKEWTLMPIITKHLG